MHSHSSLKPTYALDPSQQTKEYGIVILKHLALPVVVLATCLTGPAAQARGLSQTGNASWYGPGFQGHRTASGERFNSYSYTAAHRYFPIGCRVLVTNHTNGRSVIVRINDRGPYAAGRVIDLSYASARAIGMNGTARVSLARM